MQNERSPFQRLAELLAGIEPALAGDLRPINLTIGEPQHAMPAFIMDVIAEYAADFRRYPPIQGSEDFRLAAADWLKQRYGLGQACDPASAILPLNGSREGLFHAAIGARDWAAMRFGKQPEKPVILLPNPFYHAYAAGAHAIGAEAVFLNGSEENGFLPDLDALEDDKNLLSRTIAIYYASPANPQGSSACLAEWQKLIALARRHDFMIFADECYSELYRTTPPPGILEAADGEFSNILAFHSLSKRSNLAGLRCGFAAGDPAFLSHWTKYRNMAAPQVPLPLMAAAAAALRDEAHVFENRRLYNEKYAAANRILGTHFGYHEPEAGFFLWLDISAHGDDETIAKKVWREAGLRVIPGSYLARKDKSGINPGDGFIRLALVADETTTSEALQRLCTCLLP